jgi:phosphoribosylformimino-5-aminoimidazole carboxamide ribotide isomerase
MSNILILPSIDIKNRKTVRVVQGIPELDCHEYGNDPVEMAMIWRAENAKCLHVVDFDSSHEHSHKNYDIIEEICESVIIPVEMGGGIRNIDDAQLLFDLGVFRIIAGTMANENPEEFKKILEMYGPLKVVAAIDVMDEHVVVRGRKYDTGIDVIEYAKMLRMFGVERFIVTDVKTNGMLGGPNIELSKKVAEATGGKVTLSGGVSNYQDLKRVNDASIYGIDSVVIGRALYENNFSCQKIWRQAESGIFDGG